MTVCHNYRFIQCSLCQFCILFVKSASLWILHAITTTHLSILREDTPKHTHLAHAATISSRLWYFSLVFKYLQQIIRRDRCFRARGPVSLIQTKKAAIGSAFCCSSTLSGSTPILMLWHFAALLLYTRKQPDTHPHAEWAFQLSAPGQRLWNWLSGKMFANIESAHVWNNATHSKSPTLWHPHVTAWRIWAALHLYTLEAGQFWLQPGCRLFANGRGTNWTRTIAIISFEFAALLNTSWEKQTAACFLQTNWVRHFHGIKNTVDNASTEEEISVLFATNRIWRTMSSLLSDCRVVGIQLWFLQLTEGSLPFVCSFPVWSTNWKIGRQPGPCVADNSD